VALNGRRISATILLASVGAFAASRAAAQSATDSTTTAYEVAGLRVIHRDGRANDIVAANLYFLGGSREVTFANAGIEPLLLRVSERGTERFSREQLRRMLARTGSTITVGVDADWSVIALRTTRMGFVDAWGAFADRVLAPKLDSMDVATEQSLTVNAIAQRGDSPDALVEHLADSVAFRDHAYGVDPVGTARSVASLTPAALRAFHRARFIKSRMLLVVVGNVARTTLDSLISASLANLPAGDYRWTLPDTSPRHETSVRREARRLPTNYLVGYAPGPPAAHRDYHALRVAAAILSGQLFSEVRSRQTLTYAVSAPFRERAIGAVGLYVSTNDPVAALGTMRAEILSLQENAIDGRALAPLVQQFMTEYFLGLETNAAQADFLARAQLYHGDWRAGSDFVSAIRAVTPQDIQRVTRLYFRDINFAYVGDPMRLPDAALRGFLGGAR
jgi:zinc protease